MCSADLREFIEKHHLICHRTAAFLPEMPLAAMTIPTMYTIPQEPGICCRTLNPRTKVWDGSDADYTPFRMICPGAWCLRRSSQWRM